jgi:hypothetical protein
MLSLPRFQDSAVLTKRALTLQTVLLAATAMAALIGAAMMAVPSEGEATRACVDLALCF